MKRTAQQIGVRSFVTPTIEAWASGATGRVTNSYYATTAANGATNGGTNSVGATLTAFQLGSNYWLSKRTNLYAIYGITKTGNAVYPASVSGNTAAINANSNAVSAYAVGLRHTF
jgi:predicted porin